MPEFTTPEPITVVLAMNSGKLSLVAGDRTDTVVRVRPGDETAPADVKAAEQTVVDYTAGRLQVKAPDPHWLSGILGNSPSIDVTIELPVGSNLQAEVNRAQIQAEGLLDEVHLNSVSGHVHLDRVGSLHADTVSGHIAVDDVSGYANVNGVSGKVRVRRARGSAVVKGVNGDIWIGEADSELHLSAAGGDIFVDSAGPGTTAKTAGGSIRVGRVTTGEVELLTSTGEVEIGIGEGSTAWIDARSATGSVRNSLPAQDGPTQQADMVKVRARSRHGDIMIHRSPQPSPSANV
ncbi:DUF4097 and DUF4098 domain-containing protein YvlB [Streptomyces sp. SAI-144]|jgi:DUF4097 and DUF4098 domain-containing protein YvlB|uniref:DUF4097 family beta strand repeat-containing protein n=1 Tax=unclassified Streptomyces TaxID=2593676 RepID=UPI002473540C|nr:MULTISPECIES: DUF4097 family beta strand repeat-containing protein [unclassified Streptomyces]MDH6439246.1 DUF4097 and DUF4098 domain-containing protein YvlB [Streptomyces sp. SAI-144]MDH6486628.1 DUF4097 and DUF4098 domain-containing protein YvlB [Streptomyces sp. SAI-127]